MFNKILDTCNYVVENSKYVKINYVELDKFIKTIDLSKLSFWLSYNPYDIFNLGIENLINFLLLFESIDYSFWGNPKWCVDNKDGGDCLMYCLLNYVRKTNNYDFTKVSLNEFKDILKGNIEIPLLNERYNTLVNISKIVNDKMNGNFYEYIKDINNDKDLFEIIISNFKDFEDTRTYNNKTIYFYKLTQLLTSDILHLKELLENKEVDYSNLVGCADYKIPQTLRALNILEYNKELSDIVDNKIEIEVNSKYEVEIRSSMLIIINYISKKLNKPSIDINDYIFIYSKNVKDKVLPYHLCRTTAY